MSDTWLIGDIGGTSARFATANAGAESYDHLYTLYVSDYPSLTHAIEHYLNLADQAVPRGICLAAAGPVSNGTAQLTNNAWQVCEAQLKSHFSAQSVRVLNDFEAIAYALPDIGRGYHSLLGGPPVSLHQNRQCFAVVGPGTGLGAAGLVTQDDVAMPLVTEAGHVGFAPENDLQTRIRERLNERFARVSDERLVSGQGIENIYWALSGEASDAPSANLQAAQVFERHAAGIDAIASRAVEEFLRILGQVAGNYALALGAYDGVFVAGGVAQRHPHLLSSGPFREGFEAKGRHRGLMERIPTALVTHEQPGLLGSLAAIKNQA